MAMIEQGERVPDVPVQTMDPEGVRTVATGEVLGSGRVVLFAVPGAFTPGCSTRHLPGFVAGARDLSEKGVDRIACIAVNDVFVMDAWARAQGVGDDIVMLADGNGEFTRAMGLAADLTDFGLGMRSRRYAAVIEEGVVVRLDVEPGPGVSVSSCEAILQALSE
jgi:glutaredoxin/glutathione-dependent peroxiredoxin